MHGLPVYLKEGLPFARDLSLKYSADSYLCFRLALLHSVSYFFFLYQSPSSSLCTVFGPVSSNIGEVLSINPSANVFVFGDFNVHQKILSSGASICSTMAFPPLRNYDHVAVSVSIDFPSNSQGDAPFHCIAYDYSRADWDGLRDHLRDIPWRHIFKLRASAAASKFYEWIQVGIDVYIPHRKYLVKPHSSPWFSAACAAAIVHRNHFFCLYQQNKSSKSKVKFRQAGNCCKRVLEAAKLAYANKRKESITSQKRGSRDIWGIANSLLNEGKSAIPPLLNGPKMLSSVSDKA